MAEVSRWAEVSRCGRGESAHEALAQIDERIIFHENTYIAFAMVGLSGGDTDTEVRPAYDAVRIRLRIDLAVVGVPPAPARWVLHAHVV